MTFESWISVAGVLLLQVGLYARLWLTDRRKANQDHVQSVEKAQDRLYDEVKVLRRDVRDLQDKLDDVHGLHMKCETSLSAALTRLELLEKFRDVAANDEPTGKTLEALPPPNHKSKITAQ